jgi:hypothetical protein
MFRGDSEFGFNLYTDNWRKEKKKTSNADVVDFLNPSEESPIHAPIKRDPVPDFRIPRA